METSESLVDAINNDGLLRLDDNEWGELIMVCDLLRRFPGKHTEDYVWALREYPSYGNARPGRIAAAIIGLESPGITDREAALAMRLRDDATKRRARVND